MSLNTDPEIIKRIAFDFTHKQLLTPTLVYLWNAELDELEQLVDEIIGRMPPDFLSKYLKENINVFQDDMFFTPTSLLDLAFRELTHRSNHDSLRKIDAYVQLLLEAPCKTEECQKQCNEHI